MTTQRTGSQPKKWERLENWLRGDLDAARAQADQHQRRRSQVQEAIDSLDIEQEIAPRLTQLRRTIAGQIHEGRHGGLDSFRATLRRLFAGFELASPRVPHGSGVPRGEP